MSNTVVVVLVSVWKSEWALYDQCAIEILWLVLFLIFRKQVFILPKCAGSERVYCGCYSSIVAILCEGVYWFWVSGQYMESWILSQVRSKADLAVESALSFPLIPIWLEIQHIIISLWLDTESSLLNSLIIRVFSSFFFYYLMIVKLRASLRIW